MLRASVVHKVSNVFPHDRLKHLSERFIKTYSTTSALGSPITSTTNKGNTPKATQQTKSHPANLKNNGNPSGNQRKRSGHNSNGRNVPPWQNNGTKTNAVKSPLSSAKKGDSKAERRISDALRNRNNNTNTNTNGRNSGVGGGNRNNGGNRRNPQNTQRKGPSSGGIDKLREAFMQSLSADRERRQANAKQQTSKSTSNLNNMDTNASRGTTTTDNSNTESRLDQLLRMSKQKPPQRGGQSFRERRFQGQNSNHRNNYQQRSNEPSEAQILQKELMRESSMIPNKTIDSGAKVEIDVVLPNRDVSILELSSILRQPKSELVRVLRILGERPPRRGTKLDEYKIETDMAELVALELGLDPKRGTRGKCSTEAAETRMRRQAQEGSDITEDDLYETYPARPPVVCIMGHVDHGKTTLMDRLRQKAAEATGGKPKGKKGNKSKKNKKGKGKVEVGADNVAGTEAGGITQVVSAFQIQLPGTGDGDSKGDVSAVTFLDTPGHAAFKAMRQSGSNGADVIVLVVAADDGVSNQTIEIIDMYKNIARAQPGSISMVVAMTKVDKPGIDVDKSLMMIENQLMEHEIYSENLSNSDSEFGGVEIFPVSGITGEGLDDLIEGLVLHSEIMDLRACQESRAEGLIIDAKVEMGLGVVADCIIRWGKLELGDYVVSSVHGGKVRILNDVNNKSIKKASPSQPVRIVGLKSLPKAGDPIVCVKSEEIAKELINRREALASAKDKESFRAEESKAKLDVIVTGGASKKGFMANNVLRRFGLDSDTLENEVEDESVSSQIRIPVVLKADADGTLAALRDTLLAIEDESSLNLCIDPIEIGIGHVSSSDVHLAAESGAAIFCFNLKGSKDKTAMALASSNNVEIRSNAVIYRLLDEAKDVFSQYCPPTEVENLHGEAKVQAVFDINNNKDSERVAGLMVEEGKLYLDKFKSDSGVLDCNYRIKRNKDIIADGLKAKSLRRSKEEVTDVRRGEECGLNLADYVDVEEGDIIECYSIEKKRLFV